MSELQITDMVIGVEHRPVLFDDEAIELRDLQKSFIESYIQSQDKMDVKEWLNGILKSNLPNKALSEIEETSNEIIDSLNVNNTYKKSLEQAVRSGRSKESWFASSIKETTSHMKVQETATYLHQLDHAIRKANEAMWSTIKTNNQTINMNKNLDGFIAEQHHANSFNLQAELKGSEYRAKVLKPEGQAYTKNSVDIVIVDGKGKVVRRYQSKYCKDIESTLSAFDSGDYRGQRKLVPEGQELTNATQVIESPDGVSSKPLSKQAAKDLQNEAQSGQWKDNNWNDYKTKDLAIGIGKQAGYAALQGAAIGVGMDLAGRLWNGEEIKGEGIVEAALISGGDFGIKAATAGALKVGVEKGIVSIIPKGTPAGTIASIAYVAIENVKVLGKMATGELNFKEGIEKMEQTTVSTIAGIAAAAEGAEIGATIGTVLGPIGTTVGGFIGGAIGYMAGSKVGKTVVKVAQKVRDISISVVKELVNTASDAVSSLASGVKNIASLFGF